MNKVKLFGKLENISELKFDITKKLKVYMEIEIKTTSKDIFKCIAYEKLCEKLCNIEVGDYVYIDGYVTHNAANNIIFVLKNIYF